MFLGIMALFIALFIRNFQNIWRCCGCGGGCGTGDLGFDPLIDRIFRKLHFYNDYPSEGAGGSHDVVLILFEMCKQPTQGNHPEKKKYVTDQLLAPLGLFLSSHVDDTFYTL